jgi:hypothetical protein
MCFICDILNAGEVTVCVVADGEDTIGGSCKKEKWAGLKKIGPAIEMKTSWVIDVNQAGGRWRTGRHCGVTRWVKGLEIETLSKRLSSWFEFVRFFRRCPSRSWVRDPAGRNP